MHPLPSLALLQESLGYIFQDETLLRTALTHPSIAAEIPSPVADNQRMEFLGDAVLQLILTHELFEKFPKLGEGPLTKARAQMVNGRTLAAQARSLDLGDLLIMSHGESANFGRERIAALADALESVIGAVYLDGGFEAARACVLKVFHGEFGHLDEVPYLINPKGELQEYLQGRGSGSPEYKLESVSGPDHERAFEVSVSSRGMELGRGHGRNKKTAETQAAQAALARLRESKEALPCAERETQS